jgi:superfamily II DNA helicase RecQ
LAIDVLKGSHSVRVFNRRLQLNSAFGSLKELSEEELESLIQELEEEGMIVETEDEYPRLVLTEASKELLHDHVGELDL